MSPSSLRITRLSTVLFALVGCLVVITPFAQKASALVVTDGDCSVTYDDGAGGDANSGVVVTDIGADCVVRFTRAGGTRTTWTKPLGVTSVRVLVVGGGGDSGLSGSAGKGAGGGGQVVEQLSYAFTSAEQSVHMLPYEGGSTSASYFDPATSGLATVSAKSGGEGSTSDTTGGDDNGGSGGGASAKSTGRLNAGGVGVGTVGLGYAGGSSSNTASAGAGGGGGGGACSIGQAGNGTTGGDGGAGCSSDITGSTQFYGGGGGGGGSTPGIGQHGGGNGSSGTIGNNGVDNTGGGAGAPTTGSSVSEGGDGVVIVRYTPSVVDVTPPTLTLAASSSTSNSTAISFTLTGNEAINCATLSSSSGVDFTFTNISSITSIVQTSSSVCTINAVSTAVAGTPRTSTLTRNSSFSVSDTAGNAQTAVSGSPSSVTVTIADTTAPNLTLAAISTSSTSTSIAFSISSNETIDCSTLSSSQFTTTNIASIDSIVQTNSTTCRVNATSTATAGGGSVTSSLTASGSFSLSDSAGNAQTTLGGGTISISVNVPLSDTTPPAASWSSGASNGFSSSFTLTFSETVSGLSSSDFTNSGTATGCTFSPSGSSGTSITVSVTCTGAGTLVARLNANAVQDSAGNQGPTSASSAASTTLTCPIASSVSVRGSLRSMKSVGSASVSKVGNTTGIAQVPRMTTNGGWNWVSGATGTSRTIDGVAWNFSSQRATSLPSGTRVTVRAVGDGVGIQANPQKMSDRGGANGMFSENAVVGVSGAQLVTTDDGCTYGQMCANRGQFKISFSPAATDPILHFSGLGGGGYNSSNNGKTTSWTEFQVMNSGVTLTLLGQKNLRLVGSNRIELVSKNPTANCSTTSNGYGATASAGCGSVRFSGTFSEITLQADLGSVNNGNPYIGGRLEDAFILAATVNVAQRLVVVTTTSTTTTTIPATTTTTVPAATTTTIAPTTTSAPATTVPGSCPIINNSNSNTNNNSNNNSNSNTNNNSNTNTNNSSNSNTSGGASSRVIVDAYRVDGAKDLSVVTPDGPARINPLNGLVLPSSGFNTNSLLILDPKSKKWTFSYSDSSGKYTVVDGKVVVEPASGSSEVTMKQFTFKITDNDGSSVVSSHSVLIAALDALPADIGPVVAQESTDSFSFKPGSQVSIALNDVFEALPGETLVKSSFGFVGPNGKSVNRLKTLQGTWVYEDGRIRFNPIRGFTGYVRTPVSIKNSKGVLRNDSISLTISSSAPTLPTTGAQNRVLLEYGLALLFAGVVLCLRRRRALPS